MGQLTLHRIRRNSLMVPCRDNLKSADLSVCERNFRIDLFESKFSDRFCLSSRRVVLRRSHPVVPEATQGATLAAVAGGWGARAGEWSPWGIQGHRAESPSLFVSTAARVGSISWKQCTRNDGSGHYPCDGSGRFLWQRPLP